MVKEKDKSKKDEEFDKLLEDFIKSEVADIVASENKKLAGKDDDDDNPGDPDDDFKHVPDEDDDEFDMDFEKYEEEDEDDDEDGEDKIDEKFVHFIFVTDSGFEVNDYAFRTSPKGLDRTVFRKSEGKYLHFYATIHNSDPKMLGWRRKVTVRLVNKSDDDNRSSSVERIVDMDCYTTEYVMHTVFAIDEVMKDDYAKLEFIICDAEANIHFAHRSVIIESIPDNVDDCYRYQNFRLLRCDVEAAQNDKRRFAAEDLKAIYVGFIYLSKLAFSWNAEFTFTITDSHGMVYGYDRHLDCLEGGDESSEPVVYTNLFLHDKFAKWPVGSYNLTIAFLGEPMYSVDFEIGDEDIDTVYKENAIKIHSDKRSSLLKADSVSSPMAKLKGMIGLATVKGEVSDYIDNAQFFHERTAAGLPTKAFSLHSMYMGNPGTGKTTVAKLMGAILKEIGLLSKGHVVVTERNKLTGIFYGSEEEKVNQVLKEAQGGILFVDEAYNLFSKEDTKDPGHRIVDTLMTALSDESNRDWMLILAGYPSEMETLRLSNPGLASRLPNVYHFDDYSVEELMLIADKYCSDNVYKMTPEARKAFHVLVADGYKHRDRTFANGRFVCTLLEKQVIKAMARRLRSTSDEKDVEDLSTIEECDIPKLEAIPKFDEKSIKEALSELDAMVGLASIKKAVHDFVDVSRYMRKKGKKIVGSYPLKWSFTGNSGTGKSTVAAIFARILKAMGLIHNSDITSITIEELATCPASELDSFLKRAVTRSADGFLFVDADSSSTRPTGARLDSEALRVKLTSIAISTSAKFALVIAECETARQPIIENLASHGVADFDHTFHFPDYEEDELMRILKYNLERHQLSITSEAESILRTFIAAMCRTHKTEYANARTIKLLARTVIASAMLRLSKEEPSAEGTESAVTKEDVANFIWNKPSARPIGF